MNHNSKNLFGFRPGFPNSGTFPCFDPFPGKRVDSARLLLCLITSLAILLSACRPAPKLASATPPPPTSTIPVIVGSDSAPFEAGRRYSDSSGDMEVSFLDVVAFQATVHEESETLEVLLQMRDIPPTAPLGQTTNFIEYSWVVFVYLDPAKSSPTDIPGDFYFAVNTSINDPSESATSGVPTPTPSGPAIVPINQLLELKSVYDSSGMPQSTLEAVADPDLDLLTLTGRVPGIMSNTVFSFATTYYDGTTDEPDNYLASADLSTPLPEATQPPTSDPVSNGSQLKPVGEVRAYPGPEQYAGDVLTFEIPTDGSFDESVTVKLTLDDQDTKEIMGQGLFDRIVLPLALDTTNLTGKHTLRFTTADGHLNQTFSFEVLPASQRPENEENASWMVNEIDCCRLHYISNTAAARDIKFITEQFQKASEEVSVIMSAGSIDPKLDVYLIDRIWGNGGFASEDGLVISYTDRYYGPTIGEKGLETLARHELSHVTDLPGPAGDGIDFNYEGQAVYVAGGHYKPEPLAERGAALYDLGYYVPVGEFIDQHELSYLHAAAVLTYIVETYGSDKLWEFLTADVDPKDGQPTPLETAVQSTLGISLNQLDQDFQAWLEGKEPGPQLDDLRLTIKLQDLRRKYQETYAPPPYFIAWNVADTVARVEYLPVLIREADGPANVAVELLIANAQQAIVDGDYIQAEQLIQVLNEIVTTGGFDHTLAKDYLDIVLVLEDAGSEVLSLDLSGDKATVQVTMEPSAARIVELQKIDQQWQVRP